MTKPKKTFLASMKGTSYDHNSDRTIALQALGFTPSAAGYFRAKYCWHNPALRLSFDGDEQIDNIIRLTLAAVRKQVATQHRDALRGMFFEALGLGECDVEATSGDAVVLKLHP